MINARPESPQKPVAARNFPTRAQFDLAVSRIPSTLPKWAGEEGPRFRLEFSPGSVRVTSTDLGRKNRTENDRIAGHLRQDADMLLAELKGSPARRGEITAWSSKSRARMALRLATIDYSPLFESGLNPAMVTLTLPGDWQTVAPDAATYKALVNKFRGRFLGSWGSAIAGVWKLEFQGRGAPHLHLMTTPPAGRRLAPRSLDDLDHLAECGGCDLGAHSRRYEFAEWLSRQWADVVGSPDPAERRKHERAGTNVSYQDVENYGDPKRIGVYFSKHGAYADKEYQNVVPELWQSATTGGARFWGYWVVRPLIGSKETNEALIMHIMSSNKLLD